MIFSENGGDKAMWTGSIVAMITPFLENGGLDLKTFRHLVALHVEQGTKGLVIGGTTGEAPTLSSEEFELLVAAAVQESRGRIPIIAGVGTYDTKTSVEKTWKAKHLGADAGIAVFPYYSRPGFEGCLAHFEAIARCGLPLMIYYHPGRTGIHLSVAELAEICSLPGVVAIKDCSGKLPEMLEVSKRSQKPLFSGDDPLIFPFLEEGAQGMVSVIGNVLPYPWGLVIEEALEGHIEKAKALYEPLKPLCTALCLETNPQCIKYAMSLMGYGAPVLRLPLVLPKKETQKRIEKELSALNLLALA